MKRKFCLAVLIFQAALFGMFAANPASDFTFELNTDKDGTEWVKITGISNEEIREIEIPAEIKGVPVREVSLKDLNNKSIAISDGIKVCKFDNCVLTLSQLPVSIESLSVEFPFDWYWGYLYRENSYIEGSLNTLTNLQYLKLENVELEDKKVIIRRRTQDIDWNADIPIKNTAIESFLLRTNVEELVFEDGIETIYIDDCSYVENKNLKKVVFPSTIKELAMYNAYYAEDIYKYFFCDKENIPELVIPENVEHIGMRFLRKGWTFTWQEIMFNDCYDSLPLKTKAWLIGIFESKQAQRKFEFENNLD